MSLPHYMKQADQIVGVSRELSRVSNALGPSSPQFLAGLDVSPIDDVADGVGTIVGAVAGGYIYRQKHPYLGIIGGASLGRNIPALMNPGERGVALRNLITTGAGIGGSLYMKKHPILGFLGGAVAGAFASHFAKIGQ